MNHDEVSQICVKHYPAMLKHSIQQAITATALYSTRINVTEFVTLQKYVPYFYSIMYIVTANVTYSVMTVNKAEYLQAVGRLSVVWVCAA